ncbi:MAG: pyridoxal phosphate enzyme (YggS family) [Polyangiales bacterium]|jgi:pyridoxal phosphate enzyme (YggS family)
MSIGARLEEVKTAVLQATSDAGRSSSSVELIAVSKRHPITAIEAAYEAGQRVFGESYADELVEKAIGTKHLEGIRFRFIGHLQRNKAARVVEHACSIDSVSSVRLIGALGRHAQRELEILLQLQVVAEESKSGAPLAELDSLVEAAREEPTLRLAGLMTLPPRDSDQAQRAFEGLGRAAKQHGLETLSMGMSGDLQLAIACGSTQVRVGTAIFGPRPL